MNPDDMITGYSISSVIIDDSQYWTADASNSSYKYMDVQGKMVTVDRTHSALTIEALDEGAIKTILLRDLVEELDKSKCVEFTRQLNPHTQEVTFRARMFAVPDTVVRTLRTNGFK